MKVRPSVYALLIAIFSLLLASTMAFTAEYPKEPITIKIEGAKMAPVTFSHEVHPGKQKIACATCHHKDAENPKACTVCHTAKGTPGGAPAARDAFHTRCQGCHKDAAAKGVTAPTKCNECPKK